MLKNLVFAATMGALWAIFVLGLTSCVAQAQGTATPEPTVTLAALLADPLTFLVSKLGGVAAIIFVVIEGLKRHAPFLKDGTERAGLYLFLSALGLGVVAGLAGAVEPMPGAIPIAGKVFSGLGAGALAVTGFNGVRAVRRAKAEKAGVGE